MVLAPLVLLVALAVATGSFISAGSAQYSQYGPGHTAPPTSYGIGNQLRYVANGDASNVAIIDVGTMSIVDTVPVPNQPTPGFIHDWNPGLMNWEIHGAVPSKDRTSVYAVGALSAGSYDQAGNFRLADYEMYKVNVASKATEQEIPLQSAGQPINPVGYCGLEYNLNDENSNEIIAANMNAANGTLATVLSDPITHAPIDLSGVRGSGSGIEVGGWSFENIATGTNTGFMSADYNGNLESSTCGIAWNANGDRGFAVQQFEPLVDKVNWNTRTVDGTIAAFGNASLYHQAASDKSNGRLYATSSSGYVEIYDMNTNTQVGQISIRALTGTGTNDIHGVEVAPGNSNVLYVTSRYTPDAANNMELAIDITNLASPKLLGSVNGLARGVCGVYAIADKSEYYAAANPNPTHVGNQLLYVANGDASNVAVIDVGTMSIVDTVPVPNQPTPGFIHDWNPGLMNWEIHGAVPSKDRTSVYAVGALSAGSYDQAGNFRLADYEMYKVNVASKATEQEIPLQSAGQPINPVGYCGLEYNLNDENSNEIIAANMNAANGTLATVLSDPITHAPIDLSGVRGSGSGIEVGGWSFENIATGTNTGFMSADYNGNLESSTCGIAWNANGDRGFAVQQFEPLVDKVNWNTRTVDGTIAAFGNASLYHQAASDKSNGRLYATSSSGYVEIYDMNTNTQVGQISIRALTGTGTNDIHGVEVAPGNSNVLYVTSRYTPDAANNMELAIDITNLASPKLLGSVNGLARGVCGVYAIADKSEYYGATPSGLTLSKTGAEWASYADYTARKLSVHYSIGNSGPPAVVKVLGAVSTNGVTLVAPVTVGTVTTSAPVTLQYNVPSSIGSFMTTVYATAQNGSQIISLPGPYPGV